MQGAAWYLGGLHLGARDARELLEVLVCYLLWDLGLGFWVSSFGFGFGIRVSGKPSVSGLGFGFEFSDFGFRVSSFGLTEAVMG